MIGKIAEKLGINLNGEVNSPAIILHSEYPDLSEESTLLEMATIDRREASKYQLTKINGSRNTGGDSKGMGQGKRLQPDLEINTSNIHH